MMTYVLCVCESVHQLSASQSPQSSGSHSWSTFLHCLLRAPLPSSVFPGCYRLQPKQNSHRCTIETTLTTILNWAGFPLKYWYYRYNLFIFRLTGILLFCVRIFPEFLQIEPDLHKIPKWTDRPDKRHIPDSDKQCSHIPRNWIFATCDMLLWEPLCYICP